MTLAALLLCALPAALPAPTAPGPQGPDVKDVVDGSLRWLRAQQDRETGAYGGGVDATAWALRAFAVSPRAYTRRDGRFIEDALGYLEAHQLESGAICDAAGAAEHAQTVLAITALEHYTDPLSVGLLERARAYFPGEVSLEHGPRLAGEAAAARARELVGARLGDGSWDGPQGPVLETAQILVELSGLHTVLSSGHAGSAPRTLVQLPAFEDAAREETLAGMRRGALFLLALSDEGRFGAPGRPDAGLTAMALGALQCVPKPRPEGVQTAIDAGLAWLVSLQHDDGSIHDGKLPNYITSASVLALRRADDPRYAETIERAQRFLIRLQADGDEGYDEDHAYYGGIGYGDDERPDLSNLHMALDALSSSDSPEAAEAFKRAVKFLERTQNRSESNDVRFADADGKVVHSGDDGGAAYYPGNSKAGFVELSDGTKVPRSYGSMTYALLKGYVFAGLERDDPRVQAAWKWICDNYTLDVNPGFEGLGDPLASYQGLFYYFHVMARALDLFGEEVIVDREGASHSWRRQLCGRLLAMQSQDGSWVNENAPRWWEGNPVLATSYALIALESALPSQEAATPPGK